jgi:hypothetical protein
MFAAWYRMVQRIAGVVDMPVNSASEIATRIHIRFAVPNRDGSV